MSELTETDYGPLAELVGNWEGEKGLDVAPDSQGSIDSPYFETITYTAGGDLKNAKLQTLAVVHYRQIVKRKSTGGIFHDETGYWLWDSREKVIMHSLVIPRAVCLIAGANYVEKRNDEGDLIIEVSASVEDSDWNIIQSPFMRKNAQTTSFHQKITVGNGKMHYLETTMLDIYGKTFEHTDENELTLK
jgi:hypothetical protein